MKNTAWHSHYTRSKSLLSIPDENLVRLVNKNLRPDEHTRAVDLGCGSGRHVHYLQNYNIQHVVGIDISFNALTLCRKSGLNHLVQSNNLNLPLKDQSVHAVIAWGSLHYNPKIDLPLMLREIQRILTPGGFLFATLRSYRDTYLKKGRHLGNDEWLTDLTDIKGSFAAFYTEAEIKNNFSLFNFFEYGTLERSILGDTSSIISHWVISCRN